MYELGFTMLQGVGDLTLFSPLHLEEVPLSSDPSVLPLLSPRSVLYLSLVNVVQ